MCKDPRQADDDALGECPSAVEPVRTGFHFASGSERMPALTPEQQAREQIDEVLEASGWQVQTRQQMNRTADSYPPGEKQSQHYQVLALFSWRMFTQRY